MVEKRRKDLFDPFWNPFSGFESLFTDLEAMPRVKFSTRSSRPYVETHETDKAFIYEFALPGVKREDVNLEVDEDGIRLQVKSRSSELEEKEGFKSVSSRYFGFQGQYPVPDNSNVNKVSAKFNNGVLEVRIPKQVKQAKKKGKSVKIS